MKANVISEQLNQLDKLIQERRIDHANDLACSVLNEALKTMYAQVRGESPPSVMRTLLELEIEIGGEDGDFRAFDNRQLIELFNRADVLAKLGPQTGNRAPLSTAVDLSVIDGWLQARPRGDEPARIKEMQFINTWLRLFAMENGLVEHPVHVSEPWVVIPEAIQPPAEPTPDPALPFCEPVSGVTFVFVPGGTFSMGDTFDAGVDDEKPVHEVNLSAFYLAVHPVTQAQWDRLMPENPSNFKGGDHPVEQVTFTDAADYLDRLNADTPDNLRFGLPSEAQWEYAARSGGKTELYAGGDDAQAVAWFDDDATGRTAPVGRKAPNGLGIYDMSGNVWEWCRDRYHPEAYRMHEKTDPVCQKGGADRVIRGGSWHLDAWSVRCSRRFRFDPELFGPALGFRVLMVVNGKDG